MAELWRVTDRGERTYIAAPSREEATELYRRDYQSDLMVEPSTAWSNDGYTVGAWRAAVAMEETSLGYMDWVANRLNAAETGDWGNVR